MDLQGRVVRICKTETKAYRRDENGERCGAMVYAVAEDVKTVYSVREIPLLPEAVYILEKLREHHDRCGYKNQYLAYDGRDTVRVRSLDRTLRKLCRYCDVKYFNTHMIRKTFATMLHESGMPTRYISDLMGHSDMVTTERNYILSVVRQIICIYFLHIKCTRFWCSLEERSKLLHLFAQFIWDCFGAVLYKQFLPFFFFQRLEP